MNELLAKLERWPEWAHACTELAPRFKLLTPEAEAILGEIPDEWLSPARKRFAARLLAHRVRLFP